MPLSLREIIGMTRSYQVVLGVLLPPHEPVSAIYGLGIIGEQDRRQVDCEPVSQN